MKWGLGFLAFHFGGMIFYYAMLTAVGGCDIADYEYIWDRPKYCTSYEAAGGFWEFMALYTVVVKGIEAVVD